ncbi:uncharacterized protein PHACADRAFT_208517 [Phanerochaete carnosa HHB-10118-sp]|uniref:Protein kinase domain-containing protein n=1 Tax=Phanerochaete carnosa (strain HHB-10118-sp) TaxID=650164 RepID=K5VTZ9_PHACS|nr:uncharacterized protein PHACADRAFT_208517 [Phanerochaete carnosa HHB-10118-sp]EKM54978.1 hypothetical protein PHACADRAFT_208517 [Phanerochaete carnosa HHB-10118-sp]
MLQDAVCHDKEEIMELREDDAASFLTLADSVLYASGFGRGIFPRHIDPPALDAETQSFRDQLRRISVRLSMASFRLPEGLYLTGVTLEDARQVAGGYADIHRGQYRARYVALKTMRVCTRQKHKMLKCLKMFCREITLLHSLSHPNICELIGVDRELFGGHFCLVTDWMPYGNVMDFIETYSFVLDEVKRFVVEIVSALAYLHSKNVVHGDLHVNNILIDASRHVRLADFGLSDFSDASSASVSSAATGAVRYMAPEILSPEEYELKHVRHTPKSDVHSFAMCIWAIFNGDSPFHGYPAVTASIAICRGKRPSRDTANHELPEPLWVLLTRCWQDKAKDRPCSSDLYRELSQMFPPHATTDAYARAPAASGQAAPSHLCRRANNFGNKTASGSRRESDNGTVSTQTTAKSRRIAHSAKTSTVSAFQPLHILQSPVARTNPSLAPQSVRNLASVYPGAERLVPQVIYRPPQNQELSGTSVSPIMFYVSDPRGCGISCLDVFSGRFTKLKDPDDLIECQRSMTLRILWPDYEPWSASILLPASTTRADLATRISFYTQTFLNGLSTKCLRPSTRWRLGPDAITFSDLELVGVQPVAAQDWQVHFRVRARRRLSQPDLHRRLPRT